MLRNSLLSGICLLVAFAAPAFAAPPMKALILDGQNNHRWKETTPLMKAYLEESGLFSVDVATAKPGIVDPDFKPNFSKYDVVVSNYNGKSWPDETKEAFVKYVQGGGGFVVVHAANNSFGNWKEYNEIIGLGGWGGRTEASGPYVYLNDQGKVIRDKSKGRGGHHGPRHPFTIVVRASDHPITKGMPSSWLHAEDELYDMLRGPANNMKILATAYASPDKKGTGRHEPMMMTLEYGKGRVFHTPMGHDTKSQKCVGFIVTLQRGAEWAATGKVTQKVPKDFPGEGKTSSR